MIQTWDTGPLSHVTFPLSYFLPTSQFEYEKGLFSYPVKEHQSNDIWQSFDLLGFGRWGKGGGGEGGEGVRKRVGGGESTKYFICHTNPCNIAGWSHVPAPAKK